MISLTRRGCVDYAAAMARRLNPLTIVSEDTEDVFDHIDLKLRTYKGMFSLLANLPRFSITMYKTLAKLARSHPNALIYFPVFHSYNLIVTLLAHYLKLKTVVTIHDFKTHQGEKNKWFEIIQYKTAQMSNGILFLSHSQSQMALNQCPHWEAKSFILKHPLLPSAVNHSLRFSSPLKLLFLGRIVAYKGIALLSDVVSQIENVQLTIAGKGSIKTGTNKNISVINSYLTQHQMEQLLASHHILVLPYLEATQSGVLSLGIAAEIPLLVSNLDGLKEQVSDHACLFFNANNSSLEEAIEKLNKPSTYQELQINIRNFRLAFESQWNDDFLSWLKWLEAI